MRSDDASLVLSRRTRRPRRVSLSRASWTTTRKRRGGVEGGVAVIKGGTWLSLTRCSDGTRQGSTLLDTAQSRPHCGRVGLFRPRKDPQWFLSVLVRTLAQVQQTLRGLPGRRRDRLADTGSLYLALCKRRRRGPARLRARRTAPSRLRVHVAPRARPGGGRGLRCAQAAQEHPLRRTSTHTPPLHSSNLALVSSPRPCLLCVRIGRPIPVSRLYLQSTHNL